MIDRFMDKYRFLSSFYQKPFKMPASSDRFNLFGGKDYDVMTAEHAFQAQKADNGEDFKAILECDQPADAKWYARNMKMRPDWEEVKVDVMRMVLKEKFKDPELLGWLMDTKPHELVEGNYWYDDFWGVDNHHGLGGKNWLGRLLMEIRDDGLRE